MPTAAWALPSLATAAEIAGTAASAPACVSMDMVAPVPLVFEVTWMACVGAPALTPLPLAVAATPMVKELNELTKLIFSTPPTFSFTATICCNAGLEVPVDVGYCIVDADARAIGARVVFRRDGIRLQPPGAVRGREGEGLFVVPVLHCLER